MIITTRKIRARYEHFLRIQNAQRFDLSAAVAILHETRSLCKRWTQRHRRKWAKRILRDSIRGGLSAWFERDPFVWEHTPPVEDDYKSLFGVPVIIDNNLPPGSLFWGISTSKSDDDVVQ